ncbi:MAG TPA: aspartate-semialdehyde dehydrogenase [Gemmatimonadaceae bacterium]|nr:aspartate-semialdehyde dehydrogenase [Gemmatimonadaceae bacterium]
MRGAAPVNAPGARRRVAVLGATGAVGQAFVRLLAGHPWFELAELAASGRSAGRAYLEATRWIGDAPPAEVAGMTVLPADPEAVSADILFSALDASVAGEIEIAFASAGRMVLSNARNHRLDDDVPLVIPEVNPDHLALLDVQRERRGWPAGGGIVTNANCAAIVAVMALAPLHQRFGLRQLFIATMQAVSGAGYPGVASLDILGNVIPFIDGEEPKIERETAKLLGTLDGGRVVPAPIGISVHANRVPVEHGHTICISVGLERRASAADALDALREWRGAEAARGLPSAPSLPLRVSDEPDRPQPRRDVWSEGGMQVVIGRVRNDPVLDLRLVAMGHNVVRGAAGASVLNAELLMAHHAQRLARP